MYAKKSPRSDLPVHKDRISNLPESVICHILSRLTVKEAVRTCVLSKDWERKWTIIYNIKVNDSEFYQKKTNSSNFLEQCSTKLKFSYFMQRLLLVSQNPTTFSLLCFEKRASSLVTSWIRTILRRNVENLEVMYAHKGVILPQRLLSCTSLQKLKLKMHCTLRVPVENSLPRLTVLYLDKVKIQNENPQAESIRFTFPMLKTLKLRKCTWFVKVVDIHAPKLKTFKCKSSSYGTVSTCSIKITAEKVVYFKSTWGVPINITVTGSPARAVLRHPFETTDLQLLEKTGSQVRKLLKGFLSCKHLVLSGCLAKAMGYSKREVPLPALRKLQRLVLSSPGNNEGLVALLNASTHLKYLEADVQNWDDYDYGQVNPLPQSLMSRLEEVKFNNFTGTTSQLNLAEFVLKNGCKLKKVHLSSGNIYSGCQRDKIAAELSRIPKRSTCLMVIIS